MKRFALLGISLIALTVTSTAAARSPHDPKLRPNAADVRVAKSLLLQKSTLGAGFVDQGIDKSSDPHNFCSSFDPDESQLTDTADVTGHTFYNKSAGVTISSEASLALTAKEADAEFNLLRNPKVGGCLVSAIKRGATASKVNVTVVKVEPIQLAVNGLRMDGWDVLMRVKSGSDTIPFEAVIFAYHRGRATSVLSVITPSTMTAATVSRKASEAMVVALLRAHIPSDPVA
jgi:hypothetical protein